MDEERPGGHSNRGERKKRRPNRLAGETSPYLLQHAYNPVDWYPWGSQAMEKARREDKPILLSVGYAACHWCHVMEAESFEDEETSRLINEHFVPVKVDREERPDLDSIYMRAVQEMTGSGGWPMTVFLTPDGIPFYAGTYFPKEDRHGLPAFSSVLETLANAWREHRAEVVDQSRQVVRSLEQMSGLARSDEPLSDQIVLEAHEALRQGFDPLWGGFGGAPKFPQPMTLEFLLRCHLRGYARSVEMVTHTLDQMAAGGVYDQVGGGFHRYSVDERWHIPHFEKMLYDNAQLARLYTRAWQLSRRQRYRQVADEILTYLLREMRHPEGAFFSSQDADSEGEEGKFFVWTYEELVEVCSEATGKGGAAEVIAAYYGVLPEGNWEDGRNILWVPLPLERVAADARCSPEDLARHVELSRQALFEEREKRVHPATDDKVLAAWNGLAISAFAEAGRAFGEPSLVDAAVRAADFILARLRTEQGRLMRAWRDGRSTGPGYLDDYSMMAEACLTIYETTFDLRFYREARSLADEMLRLFRDEERGGFFQTGSDAEALLIRPKDLFDKAAPAGNSVAAEVLQRLALLTGEPEYEEAAELALRAVSDFMERAPSAFGHALCALDRYLSAPCEVAIVGDLASPDARRLVAEVHSRYLPNTVLAAAASDDYAAGQIRLLRDRPAIDGKATGYVCEKFVCQQPVTEPDDLAAQLAQ